MCLLFWWLTFGFVDFISSHLRLELDFLNEARNAQRTAALIASEPKLAGKVYVPKVTFFLSNVFVLD